MPLLEASLGSLASPRPAAEGPPQPHGTPRLAAPQGNGASWLVGMMPAASLSLAPASNGGN